MGRTPETYGEDNFKEHLNGALMWTAGLSRMNCKATINASYKGTKIVSAGPESTGLATAGESHGIAVADNGWVLYIGRGDCRTDQERGALYPAAARSAASSTTPTRASAWAAAPSTSMTRRPSNGTLNSGVTLAGKLAVYGDGGQGDERIDQADHKMEYGLLGVAPDPHFSENGWIYLQYFPTFDPRVDPARAWAWIAASRRCRARASRASRSTARPRSST